ncbi:OB-fold protein [Stenotrophomonas bentonitica]|uniref:OB-fold protein n=1 Tax=Stenotrophomonas bentonitica TaxID=1450134 RepID=UPI0002FCC25B
MNTAAAPLPSSNPAGIAAWLMLGIAWLCFLIPFPGLGMFLGWPLNMVAFILAVVAMAKGGAGKGIAQLLLSLVASPLVYLVGVVVFAGTVSAIGQPALDAQANAGKGRQQDITIAPVAPVEITARQLHRDYEANEVAADVLYKGKRLLITGEVASIQTDLMDKPQVQLKAGSVDQVMISGLSREEAGALGKGDTVLAACTGNGMILGSPMTRDCELQ